MHFRLILLVASLAHAIAIDSSISGDVPYQSDHDLSAGISPYGALDDSAIDDVSNQVPEKCNIHSVDEKTSYKSPDNDNNAAVPAQNSFDDGVLALDDGDSRLSPRQMLDGIIKFFTKPDEESSCKPNRRPEPQPQPEPYHSSPNGPIYCPNDQDNYVCCLGEPQPYIGYMVTRPNGINWNVDQCSNTDWTPEGPCGNIWTIFCCTHIKRAATTPPRPGYDLDAQFCRRPRNYPQGSKLQVNPQDKGHEGEGHTPFGYMPY